MNNVFIDDYGVKIDLELIKNGSSLEYNSRPLKRVVITEPVCNLEEPMEDLLALERVGLDGIYNLTIRYHCYNYTFSFERVDEGTGPIILLTIVAGTKDNNYIPEDLEIPVNKIQNLRHLAVYGLTALADSYLTEL